MKSYLSKTTINFVDFQFYIRPGDLLVHDTSNQNKLTVYRKGQIVKVVRQDPIGILAFLKNKFIEEITPVAPSSILAEPIVSSTTSEPLVGRTEARKVTFKREKIGSKGMIPHVEENTYEVKIGAPEMESSTSIFDK